MTLITSGMTRILRMIFARCTRSRAVRRIKALYTRPSFFRIQALDIGRRGVDRRRQVSQRAPVVKHVHLDFGDELLSGLFIPLNRHKFLRLFLVAANVTTGFMVDNQPFTRADVGDNRVTRIGRQHLAKVINTPSAPLIGR